MSRQPEKLPAARAAPSAGTEISPGRFMGSLDLRRRTPIGAMNRVAPNSNSALRFMEREECRRRTLIGPMNLRDSAPVAAAGSVAACHSGAFVPVGKTGSNPRPFDCLVTPAGVFPLGRFAFSVQWVGRVGGDSKLTSPPPALRLGEGVVSSPGTASRPAICKNPNDFSRFSELRFMGRTAAAGHFPLELHPRAVEFARLCCHVIALSS